MARTIKELLLLQFRSFFREPGVVFWAIAFPMILSGLLGAAFARKQTPPLPVMLVGAAREIAPSKYLSFSRGSEEQARLALKRGKVVLAVAADGRFLMDINNPEAELALRRVKDAMGGHDAMQGIAAMDAKGSRYIDFILPGLFASAVINSCLWGVGWVLIDYRQKKFMRRMVATPMRPFEFFTSLFIGRVLLNLIEFGTLFAFSKLLFGVEIQGSLGAFALVYGSGLLAFFGLAVAVASRTSAPQVGIGIINAITLPMMVISGMFFSYERFPEAFHPVLRLFPPTMMVDSLRAIMNEGAGLAQVLPTAGALSLMGAACLWLGAKIFKWY